MTTFTLLKAGVVHNVFFDSILREREQSWSWLFQSESPLTAAIASAIIQATTNPETALNTLCPPMPSAIPLLRNIS